MINLLTAAVDFIYPKTSIISHIRLPENNSNIYASDEEINSIPRVNLSDLTDLKDKVTSEYAHSLFTFRENDDFSKIIYQLKYGGMKKLGIYLGELLGCELKIFLENNDLKKFECIVPVPLFKTKLRERGYNQSDYICEGVNKILNLKFLPGLIKRTRNTSTQTKLSREERIHNTKDAFEINPKYTNENYGRRIILVDDVVTTGSTMNEVIKVLKESNCTEVLACSVAMAR